MIRLHPICDLPFSLSGQLRDLVTTPRMPSFFQEFHNIYFRTYLAKTTASLRRNPAPSLAFSMRSASLSLMITLQP